MSINIQPHSVRKPAVSMFVTLLLLWVTGCATQRTEQTFAVPLTVGGTTVQVRVFQRGKPAPLMLNLHDDENTSVLAGTAVVRRSGGRVIELAHSGRRHVSFELDGATYRFDPNRIFSPDGVRATLTRGSNHSAAAQQAVENFATRLIETFALDRVPVIIALHNTDGGGLSIHSYLPDGRMNTAATDIHISPHRHPGDFFYVTDRRFFVYLKSWDFNVLLQDDANVPDDGSASVYFARKGIPYLNIEADRKHLTEQTEMVGVAHKMVTSFGLVP